MNVIGYPCCGVFSLPNAANGIKTLSNSRGKLIINTQAGAALFPSSKTNQKTNLYHQICALVEKKRGSVPFAAAYNMLSGNSITRAVNRCSSLEGLLASRCLASDTDLVI